MRGREAVLLQSFGAGRHAEPSAVLQQGWSRCPHCWQVFAWQDSQFCQLEHLGEERQQALPLAPQGWQVSLPKSQMLLPEQAGLAVQQRLPTAAPQGWQVEEVALQASCCAESHAGPVVQQAVPALPQPTQTLEALQVLPAAQ